MLEADLLIHDYFENELSPEQAEKLCQWLRDDDTHVDLFVLESFLVSELRESLGQLQIQDYAAYQIEEQAFEPRFFSLKSLASFRSGSAMAAILMLGLTLGLWFFWGQQSQVIGQLTKASHNNQVIVDGTPGSVGTLLRSGQVLKLGDGRALITLACGVQLVLEGPAELEITSEMSVRLKQGNLNTTVPPAAIGFSVITTTAEFVDLGTDFLVELRADKSVALHVFDGMVATRLLDSEGEPLRISEGRAVQLIETRSEIVLLPFDPQRRLTL